MERFPQNSRKPVGAAISRPSFRDLRTSTGTVSPVGPGPLAGPSSPPGLAVSGPSHGGRVQLRALWWFLQAVQGRQPAARSSAASGSPLGRAVDNRPYRVKAPNGVCP